MPESFIVLALPHSTRPDDVHVSLFLAPRLTTTDPDCDAPRLPDVRRLGGVAEREARSRSATRTG